MPKKIEAHEKPVAYIAGALNNMSSDYVRNIRRMIIWGDMVRELGFAVFVPGIDFLCGVVTGKWDYGVAFENSQAFLARADIMFVVPEWCESLGTTKEIGTATELCIPVYYEQFGLDLLRRLVELNTAFLKGPPMTQGVNSFRRRLLANNIAADQDKPMRGEVLCEIN